MSPPFILDPGRLAARLDLAAPATAPDGQGGETVAWTPVAELWALLETRRVETGEAAGAEAATLTHDVTLRWRGDVRRGMRFLHRGRALSILSVHDPDGRGAYLLCRCSEEEEP